MTRRNIRVPVTEAGLRFVVANMRARDQAEIYALRWDNNPETLVAGLFPMCGKMCWIWERNGVPVSVQGVLCIRPGVWEVFAFGTDEWPRVVLDMTRHATRYIMPALLRVGFHRAECRALLSHIDSRKWIISLGAREEVILRGCGRDGETFVGYVWSPEDVQQRRRWRGRHFRDASSGPASAAGGR